MTVPKQQMVGVQEFRALFNQKHAPERLDQLQEILTLLVKWTGPLSADQNNFAKTWIRDFAERFLHDLAIRGAISTSASYRRRVLALLKQFESFHSLLANASHEDVGAITWHDTSMFDGLLREVANATGNLRLLASAPHADLDPALECFLDPKFSLILACRDLMSSLARKRPGYTREGPLTAFAAAVFQYSTGREPESFERQINKLKMYDRNEQTAAMRRSKLGARGRRPVKNRRTVP